jgi:predicted O-methyltransferase YrrM
LFLYSKARRLAPGNVVVEIGSYLGASSTFLAAGAVECGSVVYCVDTWQNEAMSEGARDTWEEFQTNTLRFAQTIRPLRARSVEAARQFCERVDLLFVDGDHGYEGVVMDIVSWVPKMKVGAWLLMHDFGWAEGVQRAIEEIVRPAEVSARQCLPNLYAAQIDSRMIQGCAS